MKIRIAHSPDSDDFFLFWALREGLISAGSYQFSFEAFDTQKLNELCQQGTHEVFAISLATYPLVSKQYNILEHGACFGDHYGPTVVALKPIAINALQHATIGVPGETTTACALLKMLLPDATRITLPIEPYERTFTALDSGEVDAAVLIHEGQLTYQARGYQKIIDLGSWWCEQEGLKLPLGINVISRALGTTAINEISYLIRTSIAYALDHQGAALDYLQAEARRRGVANFSLERLVAYLGMYANEDSRQLTEPLRAAILRFLHRLGYRDEVLFIP